MAKRIEVAESVTEAHPDKLADLISDTVVDFVLSKDSEGRVACETLVKGNKVILAGEITAKVELGADLEESIRETIRSVGYTREVSRIFNNEDCNIDMSLIGQQSREIGIGVDNGGAGDQGIMIGYATRETRSFMPLPITLASALTRRLTEVRKKGILEFLRPDGKAQISVVYVDGSPVCVEHITIAAQHMPGVSGRELKDGILRKVVREVISDYLLSDKNIEERTTINGAGSFVIGGPEADAGMTGRKLSVDTYGGRVGHGGGALSGKDATKVDRSATYMTRHIAKSLVAAGLARECKVCLAYEIGKPKPVSVDVDTFGTGNLLEEELVEIVRQEFPLRVKKVRDSSEGIIEYLDLRRPIYKETTNQPFGRDGFKWEDTSKAEELWEKYKDKVLSK